MNDSTQDVRNDIRATRQRMDETIGEIESRIGETADSVKRRLDVIRYARENPWAALGLALGAGLALGLTKADRRAAGAAVTGAAAARTAIAKGAVSAKDTLVGLVHRTGDDSPAEEGVNVAPHLHSLGGFGEQIDGAIEGLLFKGLTEVMASLGRGTPQVHTRKSEPVRAATTLS